MGLRAVALAISITTICAASACLASPNSAAKSSPSSDMALTAAVASPMRSPQNVVRDVYRHPQQSLSFWGLKPGMAILEIWPGAGYWTKILACQSHKRLLSRSSVICIAIAAREVFTSLSVWADNDHSVQREIAAAGKTGIAGFRPHVYVPGPVSSYSGPPQRSLRARRPEASQLSFESGTRAGEFRAFPKKKPKCSVYECSQPV